MKQISHLISKIESMKTSARSLKEDIQFSEEQLVQICKHPQTEVIEGNYVPKTYRAIRPFRVCKVCGYAEEGWDCGYFLLNYENITTIDRDQAWKYVRLFLNGEKKNNWRFRKVSPFTARSNKMTAEEMRVITKQRRQEAEEKRQQQEQEEINRRALECESFIKQGIEAASNNGNYYFEIHIIGENPMLKAAAELAIKNLDLVANGFEIKPQTYHDDNGERLDEYIVISWE